MIDLTMFHKPKQMKALKGIIFVTWTERLPQVEHLFSTVCTINTIMLVADVYGVLITILQDLFLYIILICFLTEHMHNNRQLGWSLQCPECITFFPTTAASSAL